METRETILQEINELSPLIARISRDNVFPLSPGYFEAFPDALLSQIREMDREAAGLVQTASPFTVPEDYFTTFAARVMDRIKQRQSVEAELNEIAPILNTISKQPVYKVPEGYSESLELTIPLKLAKPSARVFSFGKARRMMQYAVAACVAGILVVGAFIYTSNKGGGGMAIPYDSAMNMDVAAELSGTNEEDLNEYLNATPAPGYAMNIIEDVELLQYLEITSDEEIEAYLEESPVAGDENNGS